MERLLILTCFILIGFLGNSQDKKIELLDIVYHQGHYKKVVRVSEKMISKKGYENNPTVYLYQAAALAKLSEIKNYTDIEPDALDNSINTYTSYYELDKPNNFSNANEELLGVLRNTFKDKIDSENTENALLFLYKNKLKDSIVTKPIVAINPIKDTVAKVPKKKKKFKPTEPIVPIQKPEAKPVNIELAYDDQIVCYAKNYLGIPYRYGGQSAQGFDCSGFTGYVLGEFGYSLGRSASDQHATVEPIPIKEAKKGDLVFFKHSKSRVAHVGLVISEQGEDLTMIHSSSSKGIIISNVEQDSYWKPRLVSAGRVIK